MTTVLAVDGGNSKTDVALLDATGRLLGAVRGPTISHQAVGIDEGMARLAGLVDAVRRGTSPRGPADVAVLALAGADTPADLRLLRGAIADLRLAATTEVVNDADAALRAGTDRGWGVVVICGSGVAAAGLAPDGRRARLDALGPISGDWGGGTDVGWEGLAAAVRARDGRGAPTSLAEAVPAYFGLRTPAAITRAFYRGDLDERRIGELSPVVFTAATAGDAVARGIVDRLADEVVAMAGAMLRRLRLGRLDPDVVLGGGVFRTDDPGFHERIAVGVRRVSPQATLRRLTAPPVAGAALLALDHLRPGADEGMRTARAATVRDDLRAWDASSPTGP